MVPCEAPPDISDPAVNISGNDVELSWSDSAADHYEVWHEVNDPYLLPGIDCEVSASCYLASTSSYIHIDGFDPSRNSFYAILPVASCGMKSDAPTRVGIFNFALQPGAS